VTEGLAYVPISLGLALALLTSDTVPAVAAKVVVQVVFGHYNLNQLSLSIK